jgi:hypothetical protein
MITSTDLVLESIMETQLKLKILYSYSHLSDKENDLIMKSNKSLRRIFLVLIYSIVFKKVLSSKMNNRIVTNYFKKFSTYSINKEYSYGQKNKNLFELEYINTLSINSLYELSIVRSDYETYW